MFISLMAQDLGQEYKNLTAEQIVEIVQKEIAKYLPMRLNKYEVITEVLSIENKLIYAYDIDLIGLISFYDEDFKKKIQLLKKLKAYEDFKKDLLKDNDCKKGLEEFIGYVKSLKKQHLCNLKNTKFMLKKGVVFVNKLFDSDLGLYIGNYEINYKDCLK